MSGNNARTQLTDAEKIRGLPWRIASNALNSPFCLLTIFGSIFPLFLMDLGLPKTQIGFILSLIPFCGLIALFVAPWAARFGAKRTFLTFYGTRKFVVALLMFTPLVLASSDQQTTMIFIAIIISAFAVCRAIGETAALPWSQENVPDSMRGKVGALTNMAGMSLSILVVLPAAYFINHAEELELARYSIVIGAGVVIGLISVACAFFIPGGASVPRKRSPSGHTLKMMRALKDRNFVLYLVGFGTVTFAFSAMGRFLPLFLKEQVGLDGGVVVATLDTASHVGMLLPCFLWGWAADRYGGKPVMMSGLFLSLLLPLCWWAMPRHSAYSPGITVVLGFLQGVAAYGWSTGAGRQLFVRVVPPRRKTEYMAVFYAWVSVAMGAGPLVAGLVVDRYGGIVGTQGTFHLDPYTPIFLGSFVFFLTGIFFMSHTRAEGDMPTRRFAGMFLQGNPVAALGSLIRYNLAAEEADRISVTERLGEAKSPLNVDELIEALSDPSFNVRYEAIVSIARTRPDTRLTDALIKVFKGNEPDLSIAAAWALGRAGDKRAIPTLRDALVSGYPLLRTRSARALARLGDTQVIPILLERFRGESETGERLAYASALGTLRATEAVPEFLAFLRALQSESSRNELALALVRIVGRERYFIRLWREMRAEPGTATSRAVLALRKKVKRHHLAGQEIMDLMADCAATLGKDDLEGGVELLVRSLSRLPLDEFGDSHAALLRHCAARLEEFGTQRIEYVLLALHVLNSGLESLRKQ